MFLDVGTCTDFVVPDVRFFDIRVGVYEFMVVSGRGNLSEN